MFMNTTCLSTVYTCLYFHSQNIYTTKHMCSVEWWLLEDA